MVFLWILPLIFQLSNQVLMTKNSPQLKEYFDSDLWLKFLHRHYLSNTRQEVQYDLIDLAPPETSNENLINLTLPLKPRPVQLLLQPYSLSTTFQFVYLIRSNNESHVLQDDFQRSPECLYENRGNLLKASIDLCDGISGIIIVDSTTYIIKRLRRKAKIIESKPQMHLVLTIKGTEKKYNRNVEFRKRRSLGLEKRVNVETAVFVDRDLYRHMMRNYPVNTERKLYRFILAMINAVQLLYHDASLEFEVTFLLKRLEILHVDIPQLQRSHDIDRYLNNFCSWQEKENVSWEKSSLHWDHALMLTGLDLYAIGKSGKLSNQVLGLAPVAGMCKPSSSCTVNEGLHFESVYVVAHEIGHKYIEKDVWRLTIYLCRQDFIRSLEFFSLGMRHDGPSADNNCDPNSHIMSPTLGSGKNSWSACSNRYLAEFLQKPQAQCLFKTSKVILDHSEGGTLPGERFDSNEQCMLKYGKHSERSQAQNIEEICRDLRCTKERYTWTSHPALEGTNCGSNKWCRYGRCIHKDTSNIMERVIDGGWSEWSSYSDCASACLSGNGNTQKGSMGIRVALRTCNNPRPENGGKYCSGPEKRYQTCDALKCSNVPPVTIKEFAEQICRRAQEIDKDFIGLGFQKNSSNAEEACAIWCYVHSGGAKSRGWVFPDGTPCYSSSLSPHSTFCVSGKCEEFHCASKNDSVYLAAKEHCHQKEFTQIKISGPNWSPVGPCRYSCVTPASGLRVLKRRKEHNIQLCQPTNCNKKITLLEYATNLCTKYRTRVNKLSGLGVQLSTSLEDPDRPCHVACQDEKYSHRFYLVTGEDGWFPFGSDCARGISGKKAFCVSGKCMEFGKNNMPKEKSEHTFINTRRKRSFNVKNHTVTATLDLVAVRKFIETLNKESTDFPEPTTPTIDFDNPIHVFLKWQDKESTLNMSDVT